MVQSCWGAVRRRLLAILFCLLPLGVLAQGAGCVTGISNAQVFGYAEATFPGLFPPPPTMGTYQDFTYRYYAGTGIYLGIDSQCGVWVLGGPFGGAPVFVGTVANFAQFILPWTVLAGGGTPCTYRVVPNTLAMGAAGGYGTIDVRQNEIACTVANPPWVVVSNSAWITNAAPGSLSNGQGPAYFYVQPHTGAAARAGSVTVAGNVVPVTQATAVSPLAGNYAGRWQGSCQLFGAVSGTFSMTISTAGGVSGSYGGDDSGTYSGSVDAAGNLDTASGVASGGAYWSGVITAGGGNGTWTEPGCSGTWNIP